VLFIQTSSGQEKIFCENVVVCAGGKAAKNFGTDGSAYSLVEKFGHTVTKLYPSLVQLKTETKDTKTLKGIRVMNANVRAFLNEKMLVEVRGDVIFTEYGVSGDAIFKISSFVAKDAESQNVTLSIDLLPEILEERLQTTLERKANNSRLAYSELLCGILNNQVGRAVMKRAGELSNVSKTVKNFTLRVTGTLGFDYAQVTKGGIPLKEVSNELESKFENGLYFAGEILDVDGECGGYNLQWAYSSASAVAMVINEKQAKDWGQV
jgi:predicted Rossmann fold flavoprotein